MKQQNLVSSVGCAYIHEGRCYSELDKGSALCELFDKYFGTHKFELVPVYDTPQEMLLNAIKDLTPEGKAKVKEYVELLKLSQCPNRKKCKNPCLNSPDKCGLEEKGKVKE